MVVVLMCMIIFFTESLAECNGAVIWSNMPVGQLGIGDEHGVWVDYSEAVEKCIDAGGVIYNYNTAHDVYLKTHLSNLPLYHVAENSSTGMCTALGTNNVDVFVEDLHCRALPMFLCYQQGNFVWYDIPEGKIGIGDEHDVWLDYSEAVEKCISYGGMTYRYNPADDGFLKTHLSNFPLYHVYTSNSPSMCTALGTNNVDVVAGDLVCRTLPMFLCYQAPMVQTTGSCQASSQYSDDFACEFAIDGVIPASSGYGNEWAILTNCGLGDWIQVDLPTEMYVVSVGLYQRCYATNLISAVTISFSDHTQQITDLACPTGFHGECATAPDMTFGFEYIRTSFVKVTIDECCPSTILQTGLRELVIRAQQIP